MIVVLSGIKFPVDCRFSLHALLYRDLKIMHLVTLVEKVRDFYLGLMFLRQTKIKQNRFFEIKELIIFLGP
jgi:hypothetical protein